MTYLLFLLVLSIGIGIILYVCRGAMPTTREVHNFWVMAGWSMFAYLVYALLTLLIMANTTPSL